MGLLSKIGSTIAKGVQSVGKAVSQVANKVVNNPIVSAVGKIACPGIYNAVSNATSAVAKWTGAASSLVTAASSNSQPSVGAPRSTNGSAAVVRANPAPSSAPAKNAGIFAGYAETTRKIRGR